MNGVRGLGTSIDRAASISVFGVFFWFRFSILDLISPIVADSTSSGSRYSSTIQPSNTGSWGLGCLALVQKSKHTAMCHGKELVESSKAEALKSVKWSFFLLFVSVGLYLYF